MVAFFSNFISAPAPAPYHAPSSYHAPAYHSAYSSGKCSAMHCIQLTLFHLFNWIFNKFRLFSGYNSRGYRSADYNAPILPPPGLFIDFFLLIPTYSNRNKKKIFNFFSLKSIHVRNNLTYFLSTICPQLIRQPLLPMLLHNPMCIIRQHQKLAAVQTC